MKQYLDVLTDLLLNGARVHNRTGIDTLSDFGHQMVFDLQDGFPLVTTKKMGIKSIIAELLWFLEGSTNNHRLHELGATIWDEWAIDNGNLGPIYGSAWRSWPESGTWTMDGGVDQISGLINDLKTKPNSRRILVTAWNPCDLPDESMSPQENVRRGKAVLAPCHCLFQFKAYPLSIKERFAYAVKRKLLPESTPIDNLFGKMAQLGIPTMKLHCKLYQRSADFPLGVPYNVASYAALLMMVAQVVGMVPGKFIWTGGDCHIYVNQIDGVKTQVDRTPLSLPKLIINPEVKDIFSFKASDFTLDGYQSHQPIHFPVAV